MGSWLLATDVVIYLNWIRPIMNWVTTGICFIVTLACLVMIITSKTELGLESKKRVFLFCLFIFLGWIFVSWLFRYLSQVI